MSSWHGWGGMLGKQATVARGAGQLAIASPPIQLEDALVSFPIFRGSLVPETFLPQAGMNLAALKLLAEVGIRKPLLFGL